MDGERWRLELKMAFDEGAMRMLELLKEEVGAWPAGAVTRDQVLAGIRLVRAKIALDGELERRDASIKKVEEEFWGRR